MSNKYRPRSCTPTPLIIILPYHYQLQNLTLQLLPVFPWPTSPPPSAPDGPDVSSLPGPALHLQHGATGWTLQRSLSGHFSAGEAQACHQSREPDHIQAHERKVPVFGNEIEFGSWPSSVRTLRS